MTSPGSATPFQFPEIYSFPPFFTRQPNESTWREQRRQWCELILAYYRHYRLYSISLTEPAREPPFANRQVSRVLPADALREVVDELVKQGNAVWTGAKNTKDACLVLWRKPDVWASMIHQWASERGLLSTVLTVFELTSGDDTVGQEFHDLDAATMRRALDVLQSQGKAQLFAGSSDEDLGVKLFA
ncbi:Vacuolar protein-sorting-associated protein 25 [Coemansia thaxteri]|uniref:Vacuolar protein-sorting-associated protein 25 n=1 Tax=Coemansia thaxteri TaxID=2663907 RepID=A0A9W8BNL1_9FUNG|nr:Vacuolar protein-sorting-associated protein 25 [Coemansia thaxteri]KAJ2007745.1 Vacuolar protein-sorting-associated protein 25 [Coemansia thaxteri]KAJ2472850.1 Vacuolar protein-sorting-associated protein 25 [Coemansia sp. RSA 2322]KAJ2487507.1 Vacuolar protein-sorting-associated protein 25 [Coemansia sp. RSA 2320]